MGYNPKDFDRFELSQFEEVMESLQHRPRFRIFCHPSNLNALNKSVKRHWQFEVLAECNECFPSRCKVDVVVSPCGKEQKPKGFSHRWLSFATLEESDLPWAIGLGIVRLVKRMLPVFYILPYQRKQKK